MFPQSAKGSDLSCPECCRRFTDKYKRDRHLLIHSGLKPFACPFCAYRSNRKDPVMRHLKFKHVQELRLYKDDNTPGAQDNLLNAFT